MWLFEQDYICIESADQNLSLIDLGLTLSRLNQKYKEDNRMVLDTPDELFDKYMAIAICLPADAKG